MKWFVLLAVILLVGYYVVLKSKSKTIEKCLSLVSLILFIISLLWSDKVIDMSLFLPFVLGVFGIMLGWFGIKGDLRISLVGLNVFALMFYAVAFFAATVGFQEP